MSGGFHLPQGNSDAGAGMALKNQFQMLQVQVYDAATRTRSMIEWPAPT
ncbi:MAG: hypothetical protein QOE39_556, partial [Bradyrhizobium sp.]|nr:hypothetical protein [Bradyrhizobium sp.]